MKPLIPLSLETPRLELRLFEERDWDHLFEMFCDPDCVRYTIKTPQQKWQTWRSLASYLGHWTLRGYGPYAVVEKSSGQMIGPVGLWYPGDWPEPEIKWSLSKKFWGKGLATEAVLAVKKMIPQYLPQKRIISLILPENVASKKVAARVDATFEKNISFRDGTADLYVHRFSASAAEVP